MELVTRYIITCHHVTITFRVTFVRYTHPHPALSRHMHALYNAHHITEHDSEVDNVGVSRRMRIMNLVMILTMINIKATPKKTLSELEL